MLYDAFLHIFQCLFSKTNLKVRKCPFPVAISYACAVHLLLARLRELKLVVLNKLDYLADVVHVAHDVFVV